MKQQIENFQNYLKKYSLEELYICEADSPKGCVFQRTFSLVSKVPGLQSKRMAEGHSLEVRVSQPHLFSRQ